MKDLAYVGAHATVVKVTMVSVFVEPPRLGDETGYDVGVERRR